MTDHDRHDRDGAAHHDPHDPYIPVRNGSSSASIGFGLLALVIIVLGVMWWIPRADRTAVQETPANSPMSMPQLPSPDPSAAPSSRRNG